MKENILVTGCAGFIGFHLCKSLIADGHQVTGLDDLNEYYDVNLKYSRLKELGLRKDQVISSKNKIENSKKYKNFHFSKVNIIDRESVQAIFNEFSPQKVVNLAAQAGVRYSIDNPYTYAESNLVGFLNIIDSCRRNKVSGLIYASSSSVYGGNKSRLYNTKDRVDSPISLYGATKRANELMAHSYSHLYGLNTTGLRYFTVYGPWGRPDMAVYIFTKNILAEEPISVFNNGNMGRDFTYIDDVISGTRSAIEKNYKCEIFNLGNNKTENLMNFISTIEKRLGKKAKIKFLPMQPGDIAETCADIERSSEMLNFKPAVNIEIGIKNFIKWYLSYHYHMKQ